LNNYYNLRKKAANKRDPQVLTITSYLSEQEDDKIGREFKRLHPVVAISHS